MIDDVLEDRNPRAALRVRGRTISSARWTRARSCRPAPLLSAGHARAPLDRIVDLAFRYMGLPRSARIRGEIAGLRWFGSTHVRVVHDVLDHGDGPCGGEHRIDVRHDGALHRCERAAMEVEAGELLE